MWSLSVSIYLISTLCFVAISNDGFFTSLLIFCDVNVCRLYFVTKYCDALHRTPNEVLGYNQDRRLNSELLSILDTFDKEQYERAIRVLKAL